MTLTYPTVFIPHKEGTDFHMEFLDLEYCVADGPDLEDTVENTKYAAYNWLWMEFEEGTYDLPSQSHYDDITLEQGSFIRYIMVTAKLMPGDD